MVIYTCLQKYNFVYQISHPAVYKKSFIFLDNAFTIYECIKVYLEEPKMSCPKITENSF